MERVTDEQLLDAVWRRQIEVTARGAITRYIGGLYAISGDSWRRYGQELHIMDRDKLGISLSWGHIRRRLVRLIEAGRIAWATSQCTFWIDSPRMEEAYQYATAWWTARGVPSGYDEKQKCMRTVKIPEPAAEALQNTLSAELLARFGVREGNR
ncbi:hypothetical protein A6723_020975 [Pseudomonas sp. AU11447]|nr:hypothetical protein A6723_020975 [Pseudomonas sp. AU11447]